MLTYILTIQHSSVRVTYVPAESIDISVAGEVFLDNDTSRQYNDDRGDDDPIASDVLFRKRDNAGFMQNLSFVEVCMTSAEKVRALFDVPLCLAHIRCLFCIAMRHLNVYVPIERVVSNRFC